MKSNGITFKGIDISHYQGNVDFSKVKAAGIQAVIIKATQGTTFIDPCFAQYAGQAKASGLRFGVYHWLTVQSADYARKQADYFWNTVKGCGYTVYPALDVEERKADKAEITAEVKVFLEEFKRLSGQTCMIYASTNYIQNYFDGSLSCYPLWVAHYDVPTPGENGIWPVYAGWQYSSTGAVNGIGGNIDCDYFTNAIFIPQSQPAPAPKPAFPGAQYFGPGKCNDYILMLDKALIAHGYSRYYLLGKLGASRKWGNGTFKACQAFQRAQGWTGSNADGIPGPVTWARLGL